jgi:hypothetical protein
MPYPVISSRRIPYDIDGTEIGRSSDIQINGIASWADSTTKINLNGNRALNEQIYREYKTFWFFFPEAKEIENMFIDITGDTNATVVVKGSNDTTNGIDGTWETAIYTYSGLNDVDAWRKNIKTVSFSSAVKVLYVQIYGDIGARYLRGIHIYGRKAAGETVDDILFCDTNGNELTALKDWGDRPEGTTVIDSFKIKNASTTKIANNVNLQLNHADFGLSFSENGPWTATLDITSIAANSLSATIYIRNLLGPPLLMLGPKDARVIATVESFT